jgi:hypothetical protein
MFCQFCAHQVGDSSTCEQCGAYMTAGIWHQPADRLPSAPPAYRTGSAAAPPPAPHKAPPANRRGLLVGLGLGALVILVAIGGAYLLLGKSSPKHTLTGKIRLTDSAINHASAQSCSGSGGYSDMSAGTAVVVKDGAGKVIGTSQLDAGSVPTAEQYSTVKCDFTFQVAGLSKAAFYSVEVSHRGAQTFSAADLEAQGWAVSLTLG